MSFYIYKRICINIRYYNIRILDPDVDGLQSPSPISVEISTNLPLLVLLLILTNSSPVASQAQD